MVLKFMSQQKIKIQNRKMVRASAIRLLAAKRVPMIKFRASNLSATGNESHNVTSTSSSSTTASVKSNQTFSTGQIIEDWQLPARYRRKPIDEAECDYINRGGPA